MYISDQCGINILVEPMGVLVSRQPCVEYLLFRSSLSSFASCSRALLSDDVMPVVMQSMSIVPVVGSVADCCNATCMKKGRVASCKVVAQHCNYNMIILAHREHPSQQTKLLHSGHSVGQRSTSHVCVHCCCFVL